MKKKITLSLDSDVYDALQELHRKVSISEVISWILRAQFQEIKKGKEMSSEELKKWMDSTPEGKDFRERLKDHWGPTFNKIDDSISKVASKLKVTKKR
jgi:predicted CopG family antitoxin